MFSVVCRAMRNISVIGFSCMTDNASCLHTHTVSHNNATSEPFVFHACWPTLNSFHLLSHSACHRLIPLTLKSTLLSPTGCFWARQSKAAPTPRPSHRTEIIWTVYLHQIHYVNEIDGAGCSYASVAFFDRNGWGWASRWDLDCHK